MFRWLKGELLCFLSKISTVAYHCAVFKNLLVVFHQKGSEGGIFQKNPFSWYDLNWKHEQLKLGKNLNSICFRCGYPLWLLTVPVKCCCAWERNISCFLAVFFFNLLWLVTLLYFHWSGFRGAVALRSQREETNLSVLQCWEAENSRPVPLFNRLHTSSVKTYGVNSAEGERRMKSCFGQWDICVQSLALPVVTAEIN